MTAAGATMTSSDCLAQRDGTTFTPPTNRLLAVLLERTNSFIQKLRERARRFV